jgi:hypothetical protein
MTGEGMVRITRGNHLKTAWQSVRLLCMVLAALAATVSLHKALSQTAAAEPVTEPGIEESTEAEPLSFNPGAPSSTTPSDLTPTNTILTWTATGSGTQQDTYDVRTAPSDVMNESGELMDTNVTTWDGLTEPRLDVTTSPEGPLFWQVRSCGMLTGCSDWTDPWRLMIDGTAPASPTASVTSNEFSRTVIIAGESEPASRVVVTVGELSCVGVSDGQGNWSCEFADEMAYGDYTANVSASDLAGNISAETTLDFSVNELFVAPQITPEELPAVLEIVPVDESPQNNVFKQPVTSVIDVMNAGQAESETTDVGTAVLSAHDGIIESTESGWHVLGLPWFVWLGSAASMTAGWWAFGAPVPRRLGSLLSP